MYVATVPNRGSPPAILLRESYREGGKVKTRTLKNLSGWPGFSYHEVAWEAACTANDDVYDACLNRTLPTFKGKGLIPAESWSGW